MGCKVVYLLGCDCDYKLDEAKRDFSKSYFYNTQKVSDENRQTVDYIVNNWFDNITKSYMIAKYSFELQNRKIYNAGLGGKLAVFERVNFNDLF